MEAEWAEGWAEDSTIASGATWEEAVGWEVPGATAVTSEVVVVVTVASALGLEIMEAGATEDSMTALGATWEEEEVGVLEVREEVLMVWVVEVEEDPWEREEGGSRILPIVYNYLSL